MNRYDFREDLGEGAFGSVWRAYDLDTGEDVREAYRYALCARRR